MSNLQMDRNDNASKMAKPYALGAADSEDLLEYEGEFLTIHDFMLRKDWTIKNFLKEKIEDGNTEYLCEWQDTWEPYKIIDALKRHRIKGFKVIEEEISSTSAVKRLRCEWEPRWVAGSTLNEATREQAAEHFRPQKRQCSFTAVKQAVTSQEIVALTADDTKFEQTSDGLVEAPVATEATAQEIQSPTNHNNGQCNSSISSESLCQDVNNLDLNEEGISDGSKMGDDSSRNRRNLEENVFNDEVVSDEYDSTTPDIGSCYKIRGTFFGVRSVDNDNRVATCQEFQPSKLVESKNTSKYDDEGFAVLSFNVLPQWCLMEDWIYEFDPEIKHEFAIKKKGRNKKINRRQKLRTLELFAGAGGMSLGLRKAKFDVRWAVDHDINAISTLRQHLPYKRTYEESVESFLTRSKGGKTAGYPKKDEVDHIHGSPPCQGFSGANRYGGKNDKCNNEQSRIFVNAVDYFRPKTVTYENVLGLMWKKARPLLSEILADLLFFGYQIRLCILNAADYGDAQKRERVIIFAAEEDMRLPLKPEPTYGEQPPLMKPRTVGDAIGFLAHIDPYTTATKGTTIACGIFIKDHHARESEEIPDEKDLPDGYSILRFHTPSPTLLCTNKFIHPNRERYLTVREYACLQSFPITWTFAGGDGAILRQIGNAVPVQMATHIARSVAQAYGLP